MLARGGVLGAKRIARHLWRMCFGLFIAAGSFFLGPSNRPLRLLSTVGLGQHLSPALFSTSSCPISILVRPMFINVDWAAQTMRRFGNMLRATISQFVSKDSDFEERSILSGSPPKLIWIRARNCTSAEVESLLRAAFSSVKRFVQEDEETCLILGPRQGNK